MKQVIVVRADLGMGRGKIAAQCSHASLMALENAQREDAGAVEKWRAEGQMKIVLKVNSERELIDVFQQVKNARLKPALVQDAGHTQTAPGTKTCFGVGPADDAALDKLTGHLKLL
ncbi:peptidyl-tRNA hydrolase Pth2 [Candidatus Micrarchaeota archaeon]|nr:peptidyl-tRNA hydrolase Pth2 [Candidatus Micrarchaeota archaeon]MBU1939450.1 peptidyl-tRNA hydrolase Pth2 [Candidatus Micrarchaeota archaeon]